MYTFKCPCRQTISYGRNKTEGKKGYKSTERSKEIFRTIKGCRAATLRQHNQENLDVNLLDGIERTSSECSENDRDILRMAHLQVKHSISQKLYHELYMFNKSLPKPTEVSKLVAIL